MYKTSTLSAKIILLVLLVVPWVARAQKQNLLPRYFNPNFQTASFTENKDQVTDQHYHARKDVKYIYAAPGLKLALKNNSFSYELFTIEKTPQKTQGKQTISEATGLPNLLTNQPYYTPEEKIIQSHRVDVSFIGANASPEIIAEERSSDHNNYYLGHTPESGATEARSYRKLTYKNLYPNIDIVFYAKEAGILKYDVIVRPGGKLQDVKMKYIGQDKLSLAQGKLKINTAQGLLEEEIPLSYIAENNKEVQVQYAPAFNENIVGFQADYDPTKTLVIDPKIIWGTYFGANLLEICNGIVNDKLGNVYVTGQTASTSAIATSGAHQTTIGGTEDAFVVKFNSAGARQWATYYGGSTVEVANAIAIDSGSNIYITGMTGSSSGISTTGSHQADIKGFSDAFVAKFDSDGKRLWGTYYGGNSMDQGYSIAVDDSNNVFITGQTFSTDGISTKGAYQETTAYNDAFVVKFNSDGARRWGTYFGGNSTEFGYGIATDKNGNVFITGQTSSFAGLASTGAHQDTYGGGTFTMGDAFIAKFNGNGAFQWATYYGGTEDDYGHCIITDVSGNVYVTGQTASSAGIATIRTYQTFYRGGIDAFIVKFNTNGVRQWGTYYGGNGRENGFALALDKENNIYLAGRTTSTLNMTTLHAFQRYYGGGNADGFIAVLTNDGLRLWTSYFGDTGEETIRGISLDMDGGINIVGQTNSTNGIVTSAAHQSTAGGLFDGMAAKFKCDIDPTFTGITKACYGETALYKTTKGQNYTYNWQVTGGTIISWQGRDSILVQWDTSGTDTGSLRLIVSSSPLCQDSSHISVVLNPLPEADAGTGKTICFGDTATIGSTGITGNSYNWISKPSGFFSFDANPSVTPQVNTVYYLTETVDATGCTKTDSVTITVNPLPSAVAGTGKMICYGENLRIGAAAVAGNTYSWISKPAGFVSADANPLVSPLENTVYYLTETVSATGCTKTDSVEIKVGSEFITNAGKDTSICIGEVIKIGDEAVGGHSYQWVSQPAGFTSTDATPDVSPLVSTTYFLTEIIDSTGCVKEDSVRVTVSLPPVLTLTGDTQTCANNTIVYSVSNVPENQFTWHVENGNIISGQSTNSVTVSWFSAGNGAVKVTATTAAGCKDSVEKSIKIHTLPVTELGNDTSICDGNIVSIDAGPGFLKYTWQDGSQGQLLVAAKSGKYWVQVQDENGCTASDTFELTVLPVPDKIVGNDTTVCTGVSVSINAGTAFTDYTWQDGTKGQVYIADSPGIYWVEVITANGCKKRDSIRISNYPLPQLNLGKDTALCYGSGITLDAGEGYSRYQWSNGTFERSIIAKEPGSYWVTVTNQYRCTTIDTVNISWRENFTITIPNAFSPDGDSLNDIFIAAGLEEVQEIDFLIFNRWGELVFFSNDSAKGWDGTKNGAKLPEGIYLYKLTTRDCQKSDVFKTGVVHLFRYNK